MYWRLKRPHRTWYGVGTCCSWLQLQQRIRLSRLAAGDSACAGLSSSATGRCSYDSHGIFAASDCNSTAVARRWHYVGLIRSAGTFWQARPPWRHPLCKALISGPRMQWSTSRWRCSERRARRSAPWRPPPPRSRLSAAMCKRWTMRQRALIAPSIRLASASIRNRLLRCARCAASPSQVLRPIPSRPAGRLSFAGVPDRQDAVYRWGVVGLHCSGTCGMCALAGGQVLMLEHTRSQNALLGWCAACASCEPKSCLPCSAQACVSPE